MKIDRTLVEQQLQAIGGKCVKVKLDTKMRFGLSILETDNGFLIRLNPHRIRTPKQLSRHLETCKVSIKVIQKESDDAEPIPARQRT